MADAFTYLPYILTAMAIIILSKLLAFYGVPASSYAVYVIFYAFLLVSYFLLRPAIPATPIKH